MFFRTLILLSATAGATLAQPGGSANVTPATQPSAAAVQPPAISQPDSAFAAMTASIEKQKAAVQKQLAGGGGPADSFFSVAWTTPASIPVPALVPQCAALLDEDLQALIADSAKAQDLKPELIRAVIHRESDAVPCAISEKGAVGLMQLMPEVAQQFGADPFDPQQNVQAGSKYLRQLMSKYKDDLKLALAAYNAGPQTVDAAHKVPNIPETVAYVDAIMKDLNLTGPQHP